MKHCGEVRAFLRHHFRHFNAAALVDAAEGYRALIDRGGKMLVAMAGAVLLAGCQTQSAGVFTSAVVDPDNELHGQVDAVNALRMRTQEQFPNFGEVDDLMAQCNRATARFHLLQALPAA